MWNFLYQTLLLFVLSLLFSSRVFGAEFFQWVLTEIHANPNFISDSKGEYIEVVKIKSFSTDPPIQNTLSDPITHKNLVIFETDTIQLPSTEENLPYLICKDSTALANSGILCQQEWKDLSLTNSKILTFTTTSQSGISIHHSVPVSLEGESWELALSLSQLEHSQYVWDSLTQNLRLEIPTNSWQRGETAQTNTSPTSGKFQDNISPGLYPPAWNLSYPKDLRFDSIQIEKLGDKSSQYKIKIIILATDDLISTSGTIQIAKEVSWAAQNSILLDRKTFSISSTKIEMEFILELEDIKQKVRFEISGDKITQNNQYFWWSPGKSPLYISELCSAPPTGLPEWVEIFNNSDSPLNLEEVSLNSIPLFSTKNSPYTLPPKTYLILTGNKELLDKTFSLKPDQSISLSPWPSLENSGDLLVLSAGQEVLDSVEYPSHTKNNKEGCWQKDSQGQLTNLPYLNTNLSQRGNQSSPGLSLPSSEKLELSIDPKILKKPNSNTYTMISVKSPTIQPYSLWIFDDTGAPVRTLCRPCRGNISIAWDGKDNHKKNLGSGAYLVRLTHPKKEITRIVYVWN